MPYTPLNDSLFSPYRFDALTSFLRKVKGITKLDIIIFLVYIIDTHGMFHSLGQHFLLKLVGDNTPELLWLFKVFAAIIGADPATVVVEDGKVIFRLIDSLIVSKLWSLVRLHLLNPLLIRLGIKAFANYSKISEAYAHMDNAVPVNPLKVSPYAVAASYLFLPLFTRGYYTFPFPLSQIKLSIKNLSLLVKLPKSVSKDIKSHKDK